MVFPGSNDKVTKLGAVSIESESTVTLLNDYIPVQPSLT